LPPAAQLERIVVRWHPSRQLMPYSLAGQKKIKSAKMKSYLTLFMIPFFLFTIQLIAQNSDSLYTITGRVFYSQENVPIVGANIVVQGAMLATSADADGKFIILNVPRSKNILDVNYIGVRPASIEIDIDESIDKVFVLIGLNRDNDFIDFPKTLKIDEDKTSKWKTIKPRSLFTFKLPKALKKDKHNYRRYYSEMMEVIFDYGGRVRYKPEMKEFYKTYWIIGCRVAEVVNYKTEDNDNGTVYHMSAYFGQWNKFDIWINYKNKEDRKAAENIIASIKFK